MKKISLLLVAFLFSTSSLAKSYVCLSGIDEEKGLAIKSIEWSEKTGEAFFEYNFGKRYSAKATYVYTGPNFQNWVSEYKGPRVSVRTEFDKDERPSGGKEYAIEFLLEPIESPNGLTQKHNVLGVTYTKRDKKKAYSPEKRKFVDVPKEIREKYYLYNVVVHQIFECRVIEDHKT